MPEHYSVTVPSFAVPGDTFQAQVGNEIIKIKCPANAIPGVSKLDIKVLSGAETAESSQYVRPLPPHDRIRRRYQDNWPSSRLYVFFDLLLFILFTLSCALPVFAIQRLSNSCNATNPQNGHHVSTLYYSLYRGLGTTPSCSQSDGNLW